MLRLKYFVHSLLSGYVLMGMNILYTLISVPLALYYLPTAEFGVWALTQQVVGYFLMIDLGMAAAVARILIDHKDKRAGQEYGSLIQTSVLVNLVQAGAIFILGVALTFMLVPAMNLPAPYEPTFRLLMLGQTGILAFQFGVRIFGQLLVAHQRNDVANCLLSASFIVNLVVLWLCFKAGLGAISLIWAHVVSVVFTAIIAWYACLWLRLFPSKGFWGRPAWSRFKELFAFGKDVFLFLVGQQLITGSQVILVSRTLGLEAAAVFSICSRPFTLLLLLINRLFDYSAAAFAEMMVRDEKDRLFSRFRSIVALSAALGVVTALALVLCNQPFVEIWTQGRVGWPVINDVLFGAVLVLSVVIHVHNGFVIQTKELGWLQYVSLAEGILFVAASALLLPNVEGIGMSVMLSLSILGRLLLTLPYGLSRTSRSFGLPLARIAIEWHGHAMQVGLRLAPVALALWWLTRSLQPTWQLIINAVFFGSIGIGIFLRFGVEASVREEFRRRLSGRLKPYLVFLPGQSRSSKQ